MKWPEVGNVTLYAVVNRTRAIRPRAGSRGLMIYTSQKRAEGMCKKDGDSVLPITVDFEREPVFIRGQRLKAGK